MRSARAAGGFTILELLAIVAIIAILATIAVPLYVNFQQRARIAQAQADVQTITSAIGLYSAHTGALPTGLAALTQPALNELGASAGPFLARVPTPPAGGRWPGAYTYKIGTAPGGAEIPGAFVVCAEGDGVWANSGAAQSCP
jgi:general secretion pathway protein G